MPNERIEIYTDGSCLGNPGPGGWAAVVVDGSKQRKLSGGEPITTNNRMELNAVIQALSSFDMPETVDVFSDSKYIVDAINKGWLANWIKSGWRLSSGGDVKNPDLWKRLVELMEWHDCTFHWVKGHNGSYYNEICDNLANKRAEEYASGKLQNSVLPSSDTPNAPALENVEMRPRYNYSANQVLSALDDLIIGLNQRKFDGMSRPCGGRDCCDYCDPEVNYPCAVAFLNQRREV